MISRKLKTDLEESCPDVIVGDIQDRQIKHGTTVVHCNATDEVNITIQFEFHGHMTRDDLAQPRTYQSTRSDIANNTMYDVKIQCMRHNNGS